MAQGSDTAESDIDIIVIGDVSELRINADIAPLGRKYCRQINAGVWTAAEIKWLIEDGSAVIFSILGGELIPLKGVLPRMR